MADHKLNLADGVDSQDQAGAEAPTVTQPVLRKYTVVSPDGLSWEGRIIAQGKVIELDDQSAAAFMNEDVLGVGLAAVELVEGE